MARAIQSGATPNLIMLRYDSLSWTARDLVFVPNFAFTMSSIEKRPALTATARRAGWIGCNILICNVPIDLRITAAEAGSYKPAHGHWQRFFEATRADSRYHVHVAASLFHDIAAADELDLTAVWINRLGEQSELPRAAELPDLSHLPQTLERLVPGAAV